MKACVKIPILCLILVVAIFCQLGAGTLVGQTLTVLHTFASARGDGDRPVAPLVLSGNTVYGTTMWGGVSNNGTLFRINTDGTDFEMLHEFSGGLDGATVQGGLVLSADTLYGTTAFSAFAIKTDGSGFRVLHTFVPPSTTVTNLDGDYLVGGLALSGTTLYGTTSQGGATAEGTIFKVNTDGTGFATLYNFSSGDGFINADGAVPYGRLVLSAGTLYGTTYFGGSGGNGTVFSMNVDGSGFKALYSFAEGGNWQFHNFVNVGGANPHAGLVLFGDMLYGTAENGGNAEGGTVFKIKTDGTGFATVDDLVLTNGVGHPYGGLALTGNTLYGAAGKIFAVNITDYSYTELCSFTNFKTGFSPSELTKSGITLYGVTSDGGLGYGTIFSLSVPPQLSIVQVGTYTILNWPTNYAGFDYTGYSLQSTTNLVSPVWIPVAVSPSVIDGEKVVTNTISGAQQFFRLTQ
jgi:uncharacterized repeat protein (TIGR03803 family)